MQYSEQRLGAHVRAAVATLAMLGIGCAELAAMQLPMPGLPGAPLDESTVAAGLRQALEFGSQRASNVLSRTGGFSDDPILRLRLPSELEDLASTLRTVGFGSQVDALELQMNRAAETAVAEAVPIFASAVRSMSIADAFQILNGGDTAATDYFKVRTSDALRARFAPIAQEGMRKVGLYRTYQDIVAQYERIPFKTTPAPNLEAHVTDRALSGLWTELAKEEAKIRSDPGARTTDLLRRVFGR